MKQITVELEIPDGREYVSHNVEKAGFRMFYVAIETRPAWQPPEWLNPGWIAMDKNGQWYWHESKPEYRGDFWINDNGDSELDPRALKFTPPPCTDWKQSLREIK
jgi:hypothetical protein